MLESTSSRELTEYYLLFSIQAEERSLREDGLTPEEIADVIENRGDVEDLERTGDEPSLLDRLLGEGAAAERMRRRLELEDLEDEDEEDD